MQNWMLTELDSGERVVSERLDHVRSAAVGYWIGAGSRDEHADEAGVTHFIEHLLFTGSSRYSAFEIKGCGHDLIYQCVRPANTGGPSRYPAPNIVCVQP